MLIKQFFKIPEYDFKLENSGYQITVRDSDKTLERVTDMNASYWYALFGYHHPEFIKILTNPESYKPASTFTILHSHAKRLNELITELTGYPHIGFGIDGSGVIDDAMKTVDLLRPSRVFVSLKNAYHGSTASGLSLCGFEQRRNLFSFINYDQFLCVEPDTDGLIQIEHLAEQDQLCCIFMEFIQGVGGCRVLPAEFVSGLQELRQKYQFYIVHDGVSDFARVGQLFAFELFDLQPDIVCLGKGISGQGVYPASLMLFTDAVYQGLEQRGVWPFGRTFGGMPIACMLMEKTLELLRDGGLERIRRIGALIDDVSPTTLCGKGIMRAIAFEDSKQAKDISEALLWEHSFFVIPEGKYISIMPPLVMPDNEISRFFQVIQQYV